MTDDGEIEDLPAGDPGDLGRRVVHRRHELGLSRGDLAARAGISPAYLQYLEERPAQVTGATLVRLSVALDTPAAWLQGGSVSTAPGRERPTARKQLRELGRDECDRLLAEGGVGRVVLVEERGPVALPVNFAVSDGCLVVRTGAESPVAAVDGRDVGFEVDRIDEAMTEGWSVLVSGRGRRVEDPAEVARLERLDVRPYASEGRDTFVVIEPGEVTGRRIEPVP